MSPTTIMWIVFAALISFMLVIDLSLNRKSGRVSFKKAATWTVVWMLLALLFGGGIWYTMGQQKALEFLTGYLIEQSLSVDNLFVFIMIFTVFGVRGELQAKVLKWGILGAIVMRLVFIFIGAALLKEFQWLFYIFGALLVYTAWKMAFSGDDEIEPDKNPLVKLARRFLPMTKRIRGDWFITRRMQLWIASPLFMVLLVVESSDLVFAMDSIPAIFAITLDPFIVLTSNVFAIMGLRSLFFLLSNLMGMFAYLKFGIALILAFVGVKMILMMLGFHIPISLSLAVIVVTLAIAVVASLLLRKPETDELLETA
ncbi:TerC family protein [Trichlorobacter lovleyi]|uniref:Integral membrane protein TerC n=1 Tax=Trichlorobacter lovleyi (strain ATCC BAA-1151 / DSM 17278 / SZ) TaxID=398767 RepID=B3E366_TRIL1|nr:TerC family protein [Trichlorobacter lovleyi]ACD94278.1 Integral membrane protein TerC [Trichlorobacter lovleyi SZ]